MQQKNLYLYNAILLKGSFFMIERYRKNFSNMCSLFSLMFHPFVPLILQKRRAPFTLFYPSTSPKLEENEPRRHHQGSNGGYTSNPTTSTGISHQISPLDTSHTTLFLSLQEPLGFEGGGWLRCPSDTLL